jgi:hypothetical protein
MAENRAGTVVGYAELSVRNDVPGLQGMRKGYVGGWTFCQKPDSVVSVGNCFRPRRNGHASKDAKRSRATALTESSLTLSSRHVLSGIQEKRGGARQIQPVRGTSDPDMEDLLLYLIAGIA